MYVYVLVHGASPPQAEIDEVRSVSGEIIQVSHLVCQPCAPSPPRRSKGASAASCEAHGHGDTVGCVRDLEVQLSVCAAAGNLLSEAHI